MTNDLAQQVPAGWYADPSGATAQRWWDGARWTEHVAPAVRPYGEPAQPTRVPAGTPVDTAWIWLAVLLPLLTVPLLFMVDVDQLAEVNAVGGSPFGDLWYNLASLLGWPIYGLMVWFSYLDYAALGRLGYARRFHWAWSFLWPLVYVVGRFVMVRRQAGRGPASLWVAIAATVTSVVVSGWLFVRLIEATFNAVMSSSTGLY